VWRVLGKCFYLKPYKLSVVQHLALHFEQCCQYDPLTLCARWQKLQLPWTTISRYSISWIMSRFSCPLCWSITESTSSFSRSCTPGLHAKSYMRTDKAVDDVSYPSAKNVSACAAMSSSVNSERSTHQTSFISKFPPEDGHKTETCSGYWINIQTIVALDGNPEPDLLYLIH
jgi:hypothetical protein